MVTMDLGISLVNSVKSVHKKLQLSWKITSILETLIFGGLFFLWFLDLYVTHFVWYPQRLSSTFLWFFLKSTEGCVAHKRICRLIWCVLEGVSRLKKKTDPGLRPGCACRRGLFPNGQGSFWVLNFRLEVQYFGCLVFDWKCSISASYF